MSNIIKGKCRHCGARATVIRTDRGEDCTLLTHRCDNPGCSTVFQTSMTYLCELIPPRIPNQGAGPDIIIS